MISNNCLDNKINFSNSTLPGFIEAQGDVSLNWCTPNVFIKEPNTKNSFMIKDKSNNHWNTVWLKASFEFTIIQRKIYGPNIKDEWIHSCGWSQIIVSFLQNRNTLKLYYLPLVIMD